MPKLPQLPTLKIAHQTLAGMQTHWKQSTWLRNIGASNIGEDCERKIWLTWRYALLPHFEPRLLRLFQRGHREEPVIIEELQAAGINVFGCQDKAVGYKGHFSSHPDGKATGIPEAPKTVHLLEFKTAAEKKFKEMEKKGVQEAQPKHYDQMQIQMHQTGITRALYVVVNKNTDEIYAERIDYDKAVGERLSQRIVRIIDSPVPLPCNETYQCRWCDMSGLCGIGKGATTPELHCRTCVFSTPVPGGEWFCSKWDAGPIPKDFQLTGCEKHLLIPGIINVDVVESDGETFVLYENGVLNHNDEYVGEMECEETLTCEKIKNIPNNT